MSDEPHYELAHVHVEKYERIELVDIDIGDGLTVISGENANGKTSLLEWLRQLFLGKGARRIPAVRIGNESAKGFAVLTENGEAAFTIEQEIRAEGRDRLVVRGADGIATGKGQDWLKSLVGRGLAMDPYIEFQNPPGGKTTEARDKVRLETLARICPIGLDLKVVAEQRKEMYDKRTQVKRDAETAAAKLLTLAKAEAPAVVDLAAKRATVAQARDVASQRQRCGDAIARIDKELEDIRAKFERLKHERANYVTSVETSGPVADVSALDAEIVAGEKSNIERERILARNAQYDEQLAALGKMKKLAEDLTGSIEKLDAEKIAALAAAKFPVPGLSVTETAVIFNGLPYESASEAEQMEIAFAVCVADKPALGLALIEDAEKMGLPMIERVREIAKRHGMRVLMARRSPDLADKVEIADGRRLSVPAGRDDAAKENQG